MTHIEWNREGLRKLAAQAGQVLNEAVAGVARDMEGQPVEAIKAEITRRIEQSGLGFNPGNDFDEIALRISAGTFFITDDE